MNKCVFRKLSSGMGVGERVGRCPTPSAGNLRFPDFPPFKKLPLLDAEEVFLNGEEAKFDLFKTKYSVIMFSVGLSDRHGAGLTPFHLGSLTEGR